MGPPSFCIVRRSSGAVRARNALLRPSLPWRNRRARCSLSPPPRSPPFLPPVRTRPFEHAVAELVRWSVVRCVGLAQTRNSNKRKIRAVPYDGNRRAIRQNCRVCLGRARNQRPSLTPPPRSSFCASRALFALFLIARPRSLCLHVLTPVLQRSACLTLSFSIFLFVDEPARRYALPRVPFGRFSRTICASNVMSEQL